jgi:hypothetical protein
MQKKFLSSIIREYAFKNILRTFSISHNLHHFITHDFGKEREKEEGGEGERIMESSDGGFQHLVERLRLYNIQKNPIFSPSLYAMLSSTKNPLL